MRTAEIGPPQSFVAKKEQVVSRWDRCLTSVWKKPFGETVRRHSKGYQRGWCQGSRRAWWGNARWARDMNRMPGIRNSGSLYCGRHRAHTGVHLNLVNVGQLQAGGKGALLEKRARLSGCIWLVKYKVQNIFIPRAWHKKGKNHESCNRSYDIHFVGWDLNRFWRPVGQKVVIE